MSVRQSWLVTKKLTGPVLVIDMLTHQALLPSSRSGSMDSLLQCLLKKEREKEQPRLGPGTEHGTVYWLTLGATQSSARRSGFGFLDLHQGSLTLHPKLPQTRISVLPLLRPKPFSSFLWQAVVPNKYHLPEMNSASASRRDGLRWLARELVGTVVALCSFASLEGFQKQFGAVPQSSSQRRQQGSLVASSLSCCGPASCDPGSFPAVNLRVSSQHP